VLLWVSGKEFFLFARQNKMCQIIPLLLLVDLLFFLVVTSQSAASFIYTLF